MASGRCVGLVAVGVNRVESLDELKGAAKGARQFADWLIGQSKFGVTPIIKVLTDDSDPVSVRSVQDAVQSIADDGGLDLLILYFSGHGLVKSGYDEQVLLSEAKKYPSEAINIVSTQRNARFSGIPHVVIISDACRNAVDPFGPLGQVAGSAAISPGPIKGASKAPVDMFYATEPSQTAKEYKGEGFFTNVLIEALTTSPDTIRENWHNIPNPVIPAWLLESYLNDMVPRGARLQKPRFEQTPDIATMSRVPLFLGYAEPATLQPPDQAHVAHETDELYLSHYSSKAVLSEIGEFGKRDSGDAAKKPSTSQKRDRALSNLVHALKHRSTRLIPKGLVDEAGIGQEVRLHEAIARQRRPVPMTTGYFIFGTEVEEVLDCAGRSLPIREMQEHRQSVVDLQDASFQPPYSVIVIFRSRTMTVLPIMPGYVGTVQVQDGRVHAVSLDFSTGYALSPRRAGVLEQKRAIAAALASGGKLRTLAGSEASDLANFFRVDKRIDPTLGVYASYAYALANNDEGAASVFRHFRSYQQDPLGFPPAPTPFDSALLAGAFNGTGEAPNATIGPFCPMMSLGWSLLDSYADQSKFPQVVLDAGKRRLNAEWSTFSLNDSATLIEAFTTGGLS